VPGGAILLDSLPYWWCDTNASAALHLLYYLGSDLPKQEEQLGAGIVNKFPWNFSQNGLVAYRDGQILEVQTIAKHLGEDNVKRIVNWVLRYLSDVDIPVKVRMTYKQYDIVYFRVVCLGGSSLIGTETTRRRCCHHRTQQIVVASRQSD